MEPLATVFGTSVRRRRLQLGWSQELLGEKSGLDRTYISGIERGVRNPTLAIQEKIADALETSVVLLLDSEAAN